MTEINRFSSEPIPLGVEAIRDKVSQAISFLEEHVEQNKDPFATVSFIAYDSQTKGGKEIESTISATLGYLRDLLAMEKADDDLYMKGEMFAITKITGSE